MNAVHDGFPLENATHDEVRFWRSTSCDPFSRTVAKLLDAQPWITVAEIATGTGSTSKQVMAALRLLVSIACAMSVPKLGKGRRSVWATPAGAASNAGKARLWTLTERAGLVQHQLDWRPNETIGEDFNAL